MTCCAYSDDLFHQVGILGNASDFYDNSLNNSTLESNTERRQLMIAFDMRYVRESLSIKKYF